MAVPVLNTVDILLGFTGVITMCIVILENLKILQNFSDQEEVSMTMFFLRKETVHSMRALVYGSLVFAGTVTASALGSILDIGWLDLAAKIGAGIFMMTYLLFYAVVSRITAHGNGQDRLFDVLELFGDDEDLPDG